MAAAAAAAAQTNTAAPGVPPDPGLGTRSQEPWKENLNMHLICRECKEFPPNLVEEFSSGDTVCGSCGLVLGDRIVDTRSEWRTFSNDDQAGDDPSRVGDAANPLLNGSQLQTSISFGGGNGGRNRDLQRAQNKATHDKGTKALLAAYKEIDTFAESMQVPKVVADSTKGMYKEVHDAGAFRGKSQETLIAGMLFIACRQHKVPRTFREVFALTKVSKAEIGRIFKALEKFFATRNAEKKKAVDDDPGKFNQDISGTLYNAVQMTDPKELCERFCSQLRLSFQISKVSQEIADNMDKCGMLAGRSPLSIAAACIYTASHLMGQAKSAKDISVVAGVSDGTIRNAYKLIYPKKELLINQEWLDKGKGGVVGDIKKLPMA